MKIFVPIGIAAVVVMAAVSPAQAREGCGGGFHRNYYGRCVPNAGQQVWVVGRYYSGRGYWYNNRWWHQRYRHNGYWRYR